MKIITKGKVTKQIECTSIVNRGNYFDVYDNKDNKVQIIFSEIDYIII